MSEATAPDQATSAQQPPGAYPGRPAGEDGPAPWVVALGITGRNTGLEKSEQALRQLLVTAEHVVSRLTDGNGARKMALYGLITKARALHEAVLISIRADNPYAAFTLLRAYAENAAAVLYVADHPHRIDSFVDPDYLVRETVGRIVGHASKSRFGGMKPIYDQLSKFAHPYAKSLLSPMKVASDGSHIVWSSTPEFGSLWDLTCACAWSVELAEATRQLIVEYVVKLEMVTKDEAPGQ